MRSIFYVGLGSFIGGICRFLLSTWVYRMLYNPAFPYGTLAVNTVGCLAIGFLGRLAESRLMFTSEARLFLFIGILGGFTTFSSFGIETLWLSRNAPALALANIGLQLFFCLAAVWLGDLLARVLGF